MTTGLPHEDRRQPAEGRDDGGEHEWPRSQRAGGGDLRAGERGDTQGEVARELVHAEGQSASRRTDEVDLHRNRRRPAETLVQTEERVREDDPLPGRSSDD